MKFEIFIIIAFAFVAFIFSVGAIKKIRRAFIVPEGYVGLLHHEGQFVETLHAGRHVRWGLNYTLNAVDVRKAFPAIANRQIRFWEAGAHSGTHPPDAVVRLHPPAFARFRRENRPSRRNISAIGSLTPQGYGEASPLGCKHCSDAAVS